MKLGRPLRIKKMKDSVLSGTGLGLVKNILDERLDKNNMNKDEISSFIDNEPYQQGHF